MRFLTSMPRGASEAGTAGGAARAPGRVRLLTWAAAIGIGAAMLIMIALSLLRDSWAYPPIVLPAAGPPWDLPPAHVSLGTATVALWIAFLAGTGGVAAGLAAIGRGG